jgi:hypothetical protein
MLSSIIGEIFIPEFINLLRITFFCSAILVSKSDSPLIELLYLKKDKDKLFIIKD